MPPKPVTMKDLRGMDPATINVSEVAPDRPLPEWIGKFQKGEKTELEGLAVYQRPGRSLVMGRSRVLFFLEI